MKKYYLGLTISEDTIGWAISSSDNKIEDFGVQVWDLPNINFGNKSKASKKLRKKLLKQILNEKVFLNTSKTIPNHMIIGEWVKELQKNSNVHQLKKDAIFNNKKLNNQELAWVLLSYINRRGKRIIDEVIVDDLIRYCRKAITILNDKKSENTHSTKSIARIDKGLSFYESKMIELETKNKNPIYPCIFSFNNDSFITKKINEKKNILFTRIHYEIECKKILAKQGFDNETIQTLIHVIFHENLTNSPLLTTFFNKNIEEELKVAIQKRKQLKERKEKTNKDREEIRFLTKKILKLNRKRKYKNQNCYYYNSEKLAPNTTIFRSLYYFCKNAQSITNKFKDNKSLVKAFFQYNKKEVKSIIGGLWRILNEKIGINCGKKKTKIKRIECFKSNSYLNSKTLKKLKNNDLNLNDFLNLVKKFDENIAIHFGINDPEDQYEKVKAYLDKRVIKNYQVYKESFFVPMFFTESFFSLKLMYDAVLNLITNNKRVGEFLYEKSIMKSAIPRDLLPNNLDDTFGISKSFNMNSKNKGLFRLLTNTRQLIKKIHKYYRKRFEISNTKRLFENINISLDFSIINLFKNKNPFISIFLLGKQLEITKDFDKKQFLENEKKKDFVNAIIYYNDLDNNANTRMLVKLYLEQGGKVDNSNYQELSKATCLLTKGWNNISLKDIKNKSVDNGHIISATFGVDLIENRFIVRKTANRNQTNLMPYKFVCEEHKDLEDEYTKKIEDFYVKKSIKRQLLMIKNLKNYQIERLKKEKNSFYKKKTNDSFKALFSKWLIIELIKRDYILQKRLLKIKHKKYKNEDYLTWWKEKYKEIEKRVKWFSQNSLNIVKKNLLSESTINSCSLNLKTWLTSSRNALKRLTKWSYVIDAFALSWIQYRGEKFPHYLWWVMNNQNRVIKKDTEKNKNPISITNNETTKSEPTSKEEQNTSPIIKKPFKNIVEVIEEKIPIKLANTNDTVFSFVLSILNLKQNKDTLQSSKHFLNSFLEINKFLQLYFEHPSLTKKQKKVRLFIKKNLHEKYCNIFSYILSVLRKKKKNDVKEFLNNFSLLLKELNCILMKKEKLINEKRYLEFVNLFNTSLIWSIYQDLKDSPPNLIKKMRDSNTLLEIRKWQNKENGQNRNNSLIFISDLAKDPKKVVKKIYDGKLKYKKKCVFNHLRIRSFIKYIKTFKWTNEEIGEVIEMIMTYRKSFSTQLKRQINEKLLKHWIILDKKGHLCVLDLIGWIYNKKTNKITKPITYLEFINTCSNKEFVTNLENELLFFDREVFFCYRDDKEEEKTHKTFNYPLIPTYNTKWINSLKSLLLKKINIYSNDFQLNIHLKNYRIKTDLTHSRKILFNGDLIIKN